MALDDDDIGRRLGDKLIRREPLTESETRIVARLLWRVGLSRAERHAAAKRLIRAYAEARYPELAGRPRSNKVKSDLDRYLRGGWRADQHFATTPEYLRDDPARLLWEALRLHAPLTFATIRRVVE